MQYVTDQHGLAAGPGKKARALAQLVLAFVGNLDHTAGRTRCMFPAVSVDQGDARARGAGHGQFGGGSDELECPGYRLVRQQELGGAGKNGRQFVCKG